MICLPKDQTRYLHYWLVLCIGEHQKEQLFLIYLSVIKKSSHLGKTLEKSTAVKDIVGELSGGLETKTWSLLFMVSM